MSPRQPKSGKLRIAIVSSDILGPIKNGGVGTAYWEISTALAGDGHEVSLFFAPSIETEIEDFESVKNMYRKKGVELLLVRAPEVQAECQLAMRRSFAVYEQLRRESYDLIHFPEMHGLGYYTLLSKKLNLDFHSTKLAVQVHGPNSWHREFNEEELSNEDEVFMDFLEKKSIEFADHLILSHPSIETWLEKRQWRHFGEVTVMPPPCDSIPVKEISTPSKALRPDEVVFFGRIETRKGLKTFCDALDLLLDQKDYLRRVSFLGKGGTVSRGDALQYIKSRSARWPFAVSFLTDFDRTDALEYLEKGRKVAVIASRAETFGYTLQECLRRKIPFIASPLPVFVEQVDPSARAECFFDGTSQDLAARIRNILRCGIRPATPTMEKSHSINSWLNWHTSLKIEERLPVSAKGEDPLVSVCISHRNRPSYLSQAIRSVLSQSYQNYEIIVSDDASDLPAAKTYLDALEREFRPKNWKIIRNEIQRGPGACRNRAANEARGEYVLFMDDDNVAKPEELETFVQAARHSGSDILTCFFDRVLEIPAEGAPEILSRWLCLGDDLSSGFFYNVYGDMNSFVKRRVFLELGGIQEAMGVGCEDWEFFARAVASGFKLNIVPRALFYYRDHPNSYSREIDSFQSRLLARRIYSRSLPPGSTIALISYFSGSHAFDTARPVGIER